MECTHPISKVYSNAAIITVRLLNSYHSYHITHTIICCQSLGFLMHVYIRIHYRVDIRVLGLNYCGLMQYPWGVSLHLSIQIGPAWFLFCISSCITMWVFWKSSLRHLRSIYSMKSLFVIMMVEIDHR